MHPLWLDGSDVKRDSMSMCAKAASGSSSAGVATSSVPLNAASSCSCEKRLSPCTSKPMTVIPMVVTNVQGLIAAGQVAASDQLIDAQQAAQPGTLTVYLEPMFDNGFEGIPPGSTCIANAYTSNHDRLDSPDVGTIERFVLHGIDTVGIVHAIVLRIQALLLPVQTLVLSGGH